MSLLKSSKFISHFLQLDIEYDKFIRTTDHKHEGVVNEFYSRVLSSGDIYRADYEGLYCVNCEEYKVSFCLKFQLSYIVLSHFQSNKVVPTSYILIDADIFDYLL